MAICTGLPVIFNGNKKPTLSKKPHLAFIVFMQVAKDLPGGVCLTKKRCSQVVVLN